MHHNIFFLMNTLNMAAFHDLEFYMRIRNHSDRVESQDQLRSAIFHLRNPCIAIFPKVYDLVGLESDLCLRKTGTTLPTPHLLNWQLCEGY